MGGSYAAHLCSRRDGSACCDCYSGCGTYIKRGAGRERALSELDGHLRLRELFAQELHNHLKYCSGDGLVFLAFGTVSSAHHERPRLPLRRKCSGSGASARYLRWIDDGMRSVVAL